MSKRETTQVEIRGHLNKGIKPAENSRKECYKIDGTHYRQFSMKYNGWDLGYALACNNNFLLVVSDVNDRIMLLQFYTLEGFFVTSFKSVVKTCNDRNIYASSSHLRFTNDFILACFSELCWMRINDYNIKLKIASSGPIPYLLDSDKYGNLYVIENFKYPLNPKIGIYSFDLEFLKLFNNNLHNCGRPISFCIKEDTMFVVTRLKDNSLTLFKLDLTNGKIMYAKKLNSIRLQDSIHLCVDDMYNIFIGAKNSTHICIYYASGIIRYYSIEKLREFRCLGIAYVANCNSISVFLYPSRMEMYNLAL